MVAVSKVAFAHQRSVFKEETTTLHGPRRENIMTWLESYNQFDFE